MQKITYTLCGKCSRLKADDFVIGTGKIHSVKDFIDTAFKRVNLNYRNYIKVDKRLFRPNDKIILRANFKKAHKVFKMETKNFI